MFISNYCPLQIWLPPNRRSLATCLVGSQNKLIFFSSWAAFLSLAPSNANGYYATCDCVLYKSMITITYFNLSKLGIRSLSDVERERKCHRPLFGPRFYWLTIRCIQVDYNTSIEPGTCPMYRGECAISDADTEYRQSYPGSAIDLQLCPNVK